MKNPPLKDRVHRELKRRIINCEMMPGEPIHEEKLTAEFGLSRTPIREALLQLQRERLVEIWARKGIFVKEIFLKDIYEIYQMRLIIEPAAARLAAPHLRQDRLEDFRAKFAALDPENGPFLENFLLDRAFHDFIVESTGNAYLKETYTELLDINQRIRILSGRRYKTRVRDGIGEHLAIVDAFLAKDIPAVAEAVTRHILNSQAAALRMDGFPSG